MAAIAQGLTLLLGKVGKALAWIGQLFVAVFAAAFDLLRDVITWAFDQSTGLACSLTGSIDVSGITSTIQANSSLPAVALAALGAMGFGTAFAIIVAALAIRFVLQLIPFTRLGS